MTTVAICDFCPATISHTAGTGAVLALEYFNVQHWLLLPAPEGAVDHTAMTVACPRCAPLLETLRTEFAAGIARALTNS